MDASQLRCWSPCRALIRCATVLLAATVLIAGCDSSTTSPSAVATIVGHAVVLGDSLAVSPSMAEAFPAQLQSRIDRAGLGWKIVNAGVSGDTTADGLRRLPPLLSSDVGVLVVALGANDGIQGVDIAAIVSVGPALTNFLAGYL